MDPASVAAATADKPSLLESLAARLRAATAKLPAQDDPAAADAARASPLAIGDLVACCDALLPFFDHLGPVFHVARGEFHSKVEAVRAAGPASHPLAELVRADVGARRATKKGSATRSLHRLGGTLLFIKLLFDRLLVAGGGMNHPRSPEGSPRGSAGGGGAGEDDGGASSGFVGMVRRLSGASGGGGGSCALGGSTLVTLREAASEAYEKALAPWHTMVIKGVVRAGMLTLPSRETFLTACGETEITARPHAAAAVEGAARLLAEIEHLLNGIQMPTSDVWLWPS